MVGERKGAFVHMAAAMLRPAFVAALAIGRPPAALATPSTTDWTPMTPSIQGFGVVHLGVDNYFTVFRKAAEGGGSFPTDVGVTVGVLPFEKLQLEVGLDLIVGTDHPLFGNMKLGCPEGALFDGAPALQMGIFNVGTEQGVTNQDTVYLVVGKTFAHAGRFSVGPYRGNPDLLRSPAPATQPLPERGRGRGRGRGRSKKRGARQEIGGEENTGFMAAFDRAFLPSSGADGQEFSRLVLAADCASGDNALGGGGIALSYYFTRHMAVLTGPVFFNDEAINGKWKWTIQLDIDLR